MVLIELKCQITHSATFTINLVSCAIMSSAGTPRKHSTILVRFSVGQLKILANFLA